jgi:hypothetical protein
MSEDVSPERGIGLETALARVEQLETALESRIEIEQAKGILRERFGWTVEEAFTILRHAARNSRRNIHDLAHEVVQLADTPQAVIVALARSSRWRAAQMRERTEMQMAHARELEERVRAQQERIAWETEERSNRRGRRRRPTDSGMISVLATSAEAASDLAGRTGSAAVDESRRGAGSPPGTTRA